MPILSNFPGGSGSGGGGGLSLSPVTNIQTLAASGKVYVKWTDPEDLIVGGTTLAYWGGTLLVRKAGSAPTSRRDGTVVLDIKTRNSYANTYFCDSGLTDDTTYYYKFFPYTTTGAYTDIAADEFNATPTAQVDGIDSWLVTGMSASTEAGDGKMTVSWTDPAAAITSDGITLASWGSTTIVLKEGDYATDKDDAGAAYKLKSTTRNQYASSPLTVDGLTNGTTYYISFFPETTDGGVNAAVSQRTTGVANRLTIADIPSQSGTLTYNGNTQSPTWANHDAAKATLGGVTSGLTAGSYDATFTPTTEYRWADGSIDAKTVAWTIGKAAGVLTLSAAEVTLDTTTLTATITATRNSTGVISAVSNATNIATVSPDSSSATGEVAFTISSVNQATGVATVTFSVAEDANYYAPADVELTVNAKFVTGVLDENDWAVISQVAADGTGDNYWDVGDCKSIEVNGTVGTTAIDGTYYVYILGFAHNGATGIDFGTFKTAATDGIDICLIDANYGSQQTASGKFTMNTSNTNSGGWASSHMRKTVLGSDSSPTSPTANTLLAALPSDLRAVMKAMTIYTDNTGGGTNTAGNVTATTDYLPLLAEFEIFGARTYANSAEQNYQKQYTYYSGGNAKVKYRHSATGSTAYWWERSPLYNNALNFCGVTTDGTANNGSASRSYGLAPAFRV